MPSLFSRKRHESTPALQTAPSPPPKDFSSDPHAPYHSTPLQPRSSPSSSPTNPYSHSLPTTRTRHTSTPAYSRSHPSSSSSSSRLDARLRAHRPPSAAFTSLPRRPSPLSGPPLVAPSASTLSLQSQSYSHEGSSSAGLHLRPGSGRMALTPRPQSELVLSSSSSLRADDRISRPEMTRSISVVGDDWMRAYEAVEYDIDFDFGRLQTREPLGGDDDYSEESDSEGPGETDAMLEAEPRPQGRENMTPEDRDHSPSTGENSSTRHARTPSAGWRAWSGDYNQVDVAVDATVNPPPTEQTHPPASSAAPSASASLTPPQISVPVVSITPAPKPENTPIRPSTPPPSLHSHPSTQSTTSLQSSPSVGSTSSQKSMGSVNPNAPLPPLPSPVKSPLLDRARSKSQEPVSTLGAPPIPPKDSADVSLHVRAVTGGAPSVHPPLSSTIAPVNAVMVSPIPPITEPPKSTPPLLPAGSHMSQADAQIPIQDSLVSSSIPPERAPVPPPSTERPAPPFLVLSYKPPSVMAPAVVPPIAAQPTPAPLVPPSTAPAPESAPAAVLLSLSTPTLKTTIIPPGGAPQRRDPPSSPSNLPPMPAQLPARPSSFPTTSPSPPIPHSALSPSSSLASPPTTTPPQPYPHNPRGSMILYHVTLPSPSGARPGPPHGHTYQSFGTLGAHTNRHSTGPINMGEDGMLLPPAPSSGSGSASSSAFNLLGMNTGDAASPPTPPPANRYSSHSYARSSTYSTSADSVAAPSYISMPPLEDGDGKYAVGLMIGTVKSAQNQTLPRVGTPLAASFALRDASPESGADVHMDIDLHGSIRGSVLGDGGALGPIVAYPYDPDEDDSDDDAGGDGYGGGKDWLHDPDVWPYADGDEDFHARRGDWKKPARRWWGGAKDRPTGDAIRKEAGGGHKEEMVQLEMFGSTSAASRTSMYKAPLKPHLGPNPPPGSRSHRHPYLPPYRPPTTLDTLFGRGAASAFTLVVLVVGLLALFIIYPITQVFGPEARVAEKILGNTAINSTGQAAV